MNHVDISSNTWSGEDTESDGAKHLLFCIWKVKEQRLGQNYTVILIDDMTSQTLESGLFIDVLLLWDFRPVCLH